MPLIIKPSRLGIMTKVEPQRSGGTFVVTALGLFPLHDPSDFLNDQALWPMAAKEMPPGAVLDIGSAKFRGEILLAGHAAAPEGQSVQAMAVGVSVANTTIDLAIFGDRYWMPTDAGMVFTPPKPFTTMPIAPDRAFGGPGHPQNPAGRGFNATVRMHNTGEAVLLPNVEHRQHLIRHVNDAPPPAWVGPADLASPERIKLAGTYDTHWLKTIHPGFPPDVDPRLFSLAPAHQQISGFFQGDEPFHAVGMSPQHPNIKSALPGFRVRCLLDRMSAPAGLCELGMRIDTLWFFAGAGMGIVIYRGAIAIADPDARDIRAVLLAYERMGDAPRPASHYAGIIEARLDREKAINFLLADHLLSPAPDPEEVARRTALREDYNRQVLTQFHDSQTWFARKKATEAGVPLALLPDIPPPDPLPFLLPTPDEMKRGEVNIAEIMDAADKAFKDMTARYGPLQEQLKAGGVQAFLRDPQSLLDSLLPPEQTTPFKEQLDHSLSRSLIPEAPAGLAPDMQVRLDALRDRFPVALDAFLVDEEEALRDACARFDTSIGAQILTRVRDGLASAQTTSLPEAPVGSSNQTTLPAAVDGLLKFLAEEKSPAGAALEKLGAEDPHASRMLHNMLDRLQGIEDSPAKAAPANPQFQVAASLQAASEMVDESGERLDDGLAQLRRISLMPAFPEQPLPAGAAQRFGAYIMTRFGAGERLSGRDLAGANLRGVDFSGQDLSGTFFENADLTGARLTQARCAKAVFAGARLDGADFSRADLTQANLAKASARGASFVGASMEKIVSLETDFEQADLSSVKLADAQLFSVRLSGARLQAAFLSRVVVINGVLERLSAEGAALEECQFVETKLSGSIFARGRLHRCIFVACPAARLDMSQANLDDSIFLGGTDLTQGRFDEAQGEKSTWHGVTLTGASFTYGSFNQATFGESDLSQASFRLASLKRSLFGSAKMTGADLHGANLLEAQLRRADLTGALLRSANLYSADLSMAELTAADFTDANIAKTYLMVPADAH